MRAEELFPAGPDTVEVDGVTVRKGSIAAFVQNAIAIASCEAASQAYRQALADLPATLPALRAARVFEVFELRSPALAEILRSLAPDLMAR